MRPGIPVVYGGIDVPQAIIDHAEAIGARLLLRGRDFDTTGVPQPGLLGDFQVANAAAVLAVLDAAGLRPAVERNLVETVLPNVRLAGRGQRISEGGNEWLLDVAHNPAAAGVLATTLAGDAYEGRTVGIVAMLEDKDVESTAAALDEHVDLWIATTADTGRAIPAGELARRIANAATRPCLIAESIDEAMQLARREVAGNDRILVTGSFYVVGPVLERLYSRPES
jgi:dihydrofolate synthase/folylpolyglutamate synthase